VQLLFDSLHSASQARPSSSKRVSDDVIICLLEFQINKSLRSAGQAEPRRRNTEATPGVIENVVSNYVVNNAENI
jgi:hypothetical protein